MFRSHQTNPWKFPRVRYIRYSFNKHKLLVFFFSDYCNSSDLHIGLTLSSGIVTEYDSRGLISNDTNSWDQCLIVFEAEESWHEYWDDLLKSVSKDDWVREKYQEESFNCYTFVLKFLKRLGHKKLSEYVDDKNEFSKYVLLPKTTNAAKYISIYRELKNSNYYICK